MTEVALASLGGLDGSEVVPDIAGLTKLSERGRASIWNVLGPALGDPIPPALEETARSFAQEHGVSDLAMARGLRALRVLVLGAAKRDLDAEAIAGDLLRLGADETLGRTILSRYGEAKRNLRVRFATAALRDHGRVLTRSAVRVDAVLSTTDGGDIGFVVALLTLGYERAGTAQAITIQATRAELEELHRAIGAALANMPSS